MYMYAASVGKQGDILIFGSRPEQKGSRWGLQSFLQIGVLHRNLR